MSTLNEAGQDDHQVLPIGSQFSRVAQQDPHAPAVTCDGVTITRGELDARANRLARAYAEMGVRQDDFVVIALPNSVEWFVAALAVWKLGATVVPLSSGMPDGEFTEMLALMPGALVVGRAEHPDGGRSVPAGFEPSAELSDSPLPPVVAKAWKAVSSGGSTGRPKLIVATNDSRLDPAASAAMLRIADMKSQLVTGPLSHNMPIIASVFGLLLGEHVVVMPRFDARECLDLIGKHRIEWCMTVPTVMHRMMNVYRADPGAYDLSSLRRLWHSASPCPPDLKQAWIDVVGGDVIWEMYGGTEGVSVTVISGTEWLSHRGSVGRVAYGSMKVLDDDGNECLPGETGEIYMLPPAGVDTTYQYLGAEHATRDGWHSLGDIGSIDADGYLYVSDRRTDMYNVGGRKVYPAEVEAALSGHPAVLSCLVVSIPDEDLGQVGYGLVELAPGADASEDDVLAFLRGCLPGYKVPRVIEFRDSPLRDLAGKARRSAVREDVIRRMRAASPT